MKNNFPNKCAKGQRNILYTLCPEIIVLDKLHSCFIKVCATVNESNYICGAPDSGSVLGAIKAFYGCDPNP